MNALAQKKHRLILKITAHMQTFHTLWFPKETFQTLYLLEIIYF